MPVIKCRTKSHFTFQNVTTIIINNVKFEGCGDVSRSTLGYQLATLYFIGCYGTSIYNITITPSYNSSGIVVVDSKGPFSLTNYVIIMKHCNNERRTLTQYGILLILNFTNPSHLLLRHQLTSIHYHYEVSKTDCCNYVIGIVHMQRYGNNAVVTITIKQLNISHVIDPRVLYYYSNACSALPDNHLLITNSTFNRNRELRSSMFDIKFEDCRLKKSCTSQRSSVTFLDCQITDNTWSAVKPLVTITSTFSVFMKTHLIISNCNFNNNKNMLMLKVQSKNDLAWLYSNYISITNTNITYTDDHITFNNKSSSMISAKHTLLSISRLTVTNITYVQSIIQLSNSIIQMSSLNILAYNTPQYLIRLNPGSYICLTETSDYRIYNNNVRSMFFLDGYGRYKHYPCIIQFISTKESLDENFTDLYNITIKNNTEKQSMFPGRELFNITITKDCEMIPSTAFNQSSYDKLAKTFVVENNTNRQMHDICNCDGNGKPKCSYGDDDEHDVLVATYPGKTVTTTFTVPHNNYTLQTITLSVDESRSRTSSYSCKIVNENELRQHRSNNCSEFQYTLSYPDNSKCSLYLRETEALDVTERFWITLEPCPLGFSLDTKRNSCHCDQILQQYSLPVISCDINNKMITRQANSWIHGEERNRSQVSNYFYIYKASSSCPFDYCQQHSSELLPNEPDVQCQYNRTGIVCGHCPVSLSTIFGSSKCKQCSNVYLLIIIPIAIAGVMLVLLMFTLNLTIVNGTITTFILYVNIVSVNKTLLFPTHLSSTIPLYVMIAMANLDLGVEVCFYNGMDDYAKMWLQLAFPFYLMFIAASLIIVSRYFRIA